MRRQHAKLERVSLAAWSAAQVQLDIHELLRGGATCESPELVPHHEKMDELRPKFERPEEHFGIDYIGKSLAMRRQLATEEGMQSSQYDTLVRERRELHVSMRREQVDEDIVLGISEVALNGQLHRYAESTLAEAA